jgi:hypothetical protein
MKLQALHRTARRTLHADAPPADVFPLLCPVRERDWVDGWEADVLCSASGHAELGCVFVAYPGSDHEATFVVTRFEPPRAVEFAIFDGALVQTLHIELVPATGGTEMTWTRAFTATSAEGNAWIEKNVPAGVEARLDALEGMMARYLARA